VGTAKTTNLPLFFLLKMRRQNADIALIINPRLSAA